MRKIEWTTALLLALAVPAAATADDDPCNAQAQTVVEEIEAGPTGALSSRERGIALSAAVRGCKTERMRIAEIAVSAPTRTTEPSRPAGEAPSGGTGEAPSGGTGAAPSGEAGAAEAASAAPERSAESVGFLEGLKRWLEQPNECERIRRANGRIVSRCD